MRKTTTIVTCTGPNCKEIAEVTDIAEAPEGWYLVQPTTQSKLSHSYDRNAGFEFHSLRCVEKWAEARRKFQKEAIPTGRPSFEMEITPDTEGLINEATKVRATTRELVNEAIEALEGAEFTPRDIVDLVGVTPTRNANTIRQMVRQLYEDGVITLVRQKFGPPGNTYRQ